MQSLRGWFGSSHAALIVAPDVYDPLVLEGVWAAVPALLRAKTAVFKDYPLIKRYLSDLGPTIALLVVAIERFQTTRDLTA